MQMTLKSIAHFVDLQQSSQVESLIVNTLYFWHLMRGLNLSAPNLSFQQTLTWVTRQLINSQTNWNIPVALSLQFINPLRRSSVAMLHLPLSDQIHMSWLAGVVDTDD